MYKSNRWVNWVLKFLDLKYINYEKYVSLKIWEMLSGQQIPEIPSNSKCVCIFWNLENEDKEMVPFDFSSETEESISRKIIEMKEYINNNFSLLAIVWKN